MSLKLARELKRPPISIAKELEVSISASGGAGLIASVVAHPSGYLNFTLNWPLFALGTISEARAGVGSLGVESGAS